MPSDTFRPLTTGAAAGVDDTMLRVLHSEPLLSRTNYFDGRLLTAEDLDRDYAYLDRRLLDLGLAAGDGIVSGLQASLAGTVLSVTGGRAIAASGRVLTLNRAAGQALQVDLADMGAVMSRNTAFVGFRDGLYAVVLMLTEAGTGAADVFPRDLASRRTTSFDTITDFVEIALVPLRQPLPAGDAFHARAALAGSFAGRGIDRSLPGDSVALGVVAMRRGSPAWFDASLVAHPLRPLDLDNLLQLDLAQAYAALFTDLTAAAGSSFRATDYLSLLPPAGPVPKPAIDPANGAQSFFPEQIEVAIAPVRADELAALTNEAMRLPPIDLSSGAPAQVIVLAPLAPSDFGLLMRALEGSPKQPAPVAFQPYPTIALSRIDPLILRLPGRLPPPARPTTADAWTRAWPQVQAPLRYLLRQPDVSIGGLSIARLAAGFTEPPSGLPPDDPALVQLRQQVQDAQDALAAANARAANADTQRQAAQAQVTALQGVLAKVATQLTASGVASGSGVGDPTRTDAIIADWTRVNQNAAQQLATANGQLTAVNGQLTTANNQLNAARTQITTMQTTSKAQLNPHLAQLAPLGINIAALTALGLAG
jgi:hypothetical protein